MGREAKEMACELGNEGGKPEGAKLEELGWGPTQRGTQCAPVKRKGDVVHSVTNLSKAPGVQRWKNDGSFRSSSDQEVTTK